MIVTFKASALLLTSWREYLIRFALGGATTVAAGLIAAAFGPVIGGLFLAFPAIFPATATLVESHVRENKEKKGLAGGRRGKEAAALDALGGALGSLGLAGFAAIVWMGIARSAPLALTAAAAIWFAAAVAAWRGRRKLLSSIYARRTPLPVAAPRRNRPSSQL